MASSKFSLTFLIFQGDRLVREERLSQSVIKVGKVPSAHLRIDDESVSRMHAIIEVTGGGEVSIIDLGSTRGTFVNGQKINKAKLHTGDAIGLGDSRVEIAIAEPAVIIADVEAQPVAPAAPAAAARAAVPPPVPVASRPAAPAPVAPAAARVAAPTPAPFAPSFAFPLASAPSPLAFQAAASDLVDERGAKAVEVAAMLGDSVVGVKHCMDPRAGKITTATWAFAAGGLACLLASATAFYVSIDTAARNKSAFEYHTRVQHKPAFAFRPREVGAPVSGLAFGGLALGLAASVTALVRARSERKSPFYRIGTAPGVEQPVEGAPSESFPLVAPSGDDFVFNYGAGMEGELIVDGRSTSLAELAATGRARPSATAVGAVEIPIPQAAKIRARAGQTTFLVSAVAKPKQQRASMLAMLEGRPLKYAAGSLVAHLGIVLLLSQVGEDAAGVAITMESRETLGTLAKLNAVEDAPKPDPEEGNDGETKGDKTEEVAMAMPDEEGRSGDPKHPSDQSQIRVKDNKTEPQITREQAVEAARQAGIMGSTRLRDSISSLSGVEGITSGFDGESVFGAFDGVEGAGRGTFGTGRSGDGIGGGCFNPPCGIIIGGRYGTIPTGKLAGDGYRTGRPPGLRDHIAASPILTGPKEVSGGTLDKSIIKRYIKRNEQAIGYCYEKELLARPGLAGTVSIQFLISTSGGGQGFDDNVTSCVANVIKNIAFPAPKDGLSVTVNYPFTFRAAGQ
jgi:hypothetical protein